MSNPVLLQNNFLKMQRDKSRDQLGQDELWNVVDYIPNLGAPIRKRGGWSYASPDLSSVTALVTIAENCIYARFSGGAKNCVVGFRSSDSARRLFTVASVASATDIGTTFNNPISDLIFYREKLVLLSGGNAPKYYDGAATIAALSGAGPASGQFGCVYKDRLVVSPGYSFVNSNRVYFSAAADPTTWDTTLRFIDTSAPVTCLAPLQNALLVFHPDSIERIRGDVPPGSAATNMQLESFINANGVSGRANTLVYGNYVYWANSDGVFQTDGAADPANLTRQGGIEDYWREISTSQLSYAMGIYGNEYLIVSIMDGGGAVDTLVCHLQSRSWQRFNNITAVWFALDSNNELYWADRARPRLDSASTMYSPASAVKNDADGDAVVGTIETGIFDHGSFSKKRWGGVYLSYDCRDAASDNPSLSLSYLTDPAETSYTSVTGSYAETTGRTRYSLPLNKSAYGVGLKIVQTGASSDTRIYGLEAEVFQEEGSR